MNYLDIKESVYKLLIVAIILPLWLFNHSAEAKAPVVLNSIPSLNGSEVSKSLGNLVKKQYAKPEYLEIPALGIKAEVEEVGVNDDGSMEVPTDFAKVGWLRSSSKVSENGNLVLSGHFDTPNGSPAVFYDLYNIEEHSIVAVGSRVEGQSTKKKYYRIVSKHLVDPNNLEHIQLAFEKTEKPTLTLITCYGIWDALKQEYTHRVVVKGELIN
jgi:sortase A